MAKDPYKYYRVEAAELLDNLNRGVLELEKGVADPAMVSDLFRLAHTLKGASQVVRQPGIAQAAHALEDILSPLREGGSPATRQQTSQVLGWLDQIGAQLAALEAPAPAGVVASAIDGALGESARRLCGLAGHARATARALRGGAKLARSAPLCHARGVVLPGQPLESVRLGVAPARGALPELVVDRRPCAGVSVPQDPLRGHGGVRPAATGNGGAVAANRPFRSSAGAGFGISGAAFGAARAVLRDCGRAGIGRGRRGLLGAGGVAR